MLNTKKVISFQVSGRKVLFKTYMGKNLKNGMPLIFIKAKKQLN